MRENEKNLLPKKCGKTLAMATTTVAAAAAATDRNALFYYLRGHTPHKSNKMTTKIALSLECNSTNKSTANFFALFSFFRSFEIIHLQK